MRGNRWTASQSQSEQIWLIWASTGARLAVDRVSDGTFIGWYSLNRWNPDYRSASLGYCFDDAAWGHGYATEAARGLLRWAFPPAESSLPRKTLPGTRVLRFAASRDRLGGESGAVGLILAGEQARG